MGCAGLKCNRDGLGLPWVGSAAGWAVAPVALAVWSVGARAWALGAAIFEQLIMKIFELFEGTPVLEEFIEALDEIFKAAGSGHRDTAQSH